MEEAIGEWEALVARDPNHAQYRLDLGIAYAIAGRGGDAELQWLAAVDLAPESTAPLANLATLYLDGGRRDDAAMVIDRIRRIDPSDPVLEDLEARLGAIQRENG